MTTSIQLRVPYGLPYGTLVYINQLQISTQYWNKSVEVVVILVFDHDLTLTNASVRQLELDSWAQLLLKLSLVFLDAQNNPLVRKLDRNAGIWVLFFLWGVWVCLLSFCADCLCNLFDNFVDVIIIVVIIVSVSACASGSSLDRLLLILFLESCNKC